MRLGDLDALSAFVGDLRSALHKEQSTFKAMTQSEFEIKDSMLLSFQYAIDNATTVELTEEQAIDKLHETGWLIRHDKEMTKRPQGECRTCRHRDPEDKKCDCGGLERQGCQFPVSDDYFCKFYEKGGAENEGPVLLTF